MPMHDWTKVEAGLYHDFHTSWLVEIRNALNKRLLPSSYYTLVEQNSFGIFERMPSSESIPQPHALSNKNGNRSPLF